MSRRSAERGGRLFLLEGGGEGEVVEERFEQWVQPSRLVDFSAASFL